MTVRNPEVVLAGIFALLVRGGDDRLRLGQSEPRHRMNERID
jgi:hypothetical protein